MYNQPEDLPVDSCIVDLAYCISLDIKDAFVIFQVFFVKRVIPSDSQKGFSVLPVLREEQSFPLCCLSIQK